MHRSIFARKSGILLHPTCFPGPEGIGTFGIEARRFLDFCQQSGQGLWQTCPLGPTGFGDSPYQCFSAFAGNPLLIDLRLLQESGWLVKADLAPLKKLPENKVDFGPLIQKKDQILRKAFSIFCQTIANQPGLSARFTAFRTKNADWLPDFCLFMALKKQFNGSSWNNWPLEIRSRQPTAIDHWKTVLKDEIDYHEFLQFQFTEQWSSLTSYAHQLGIEIIGDMPIFVAHDSADVWSKPEFFLLDKQGRPTFVAGVPPDYFSATGQLWGNPLYDWDAMQKDGFTWWLRILSSKLEMYDFIRIDHFRGFAAFWTVPFGQETAIQGTWQPAPGKDLFTVVREKLGTAPIIAEDLGLITPEVTELIAHCGFPGMKVLQFAFDSQEINNHLPHNYCANSAAYTGTHDNDTVRGWYAHASKADRRFARDYLKNRNPRFIHWDFVQTCLASVSKFAIFPLQDVLGLGSDSRMNLPGTIGKNWQWRYKLKALQPNIAKKLRKLTDLYARL